MHRRSMPMPMPPAGGRPCSRATSPAVAGFVELLLLAAGLVLQRVALRDGIVLLGVAGRNLFKGTPGNSSPGFIGAGKSGGG